MHYLTVQDVLWINLQITKRTQAFNYARLEEATFYQYAYGQSASPLSQAGRFLSGFAHKKPFAAGNEATALVGCLSFLKLNGLDATLSDDAGVRWLEHAMRDPSAASTALAEITTENPEYKDELAPDVHDAVHEIMDAFPRTISLIAKGMHATVV